MPNSYIELYDNSLKIQSYAGSLSSSLDQFLLAQEEIEENQIVSNSVANKLASKSIFRAEKKLTQKTMIKAIKKIKVEIDQLQANGKGDDHKRITEILNQYYSLLPGKGPMHEFMDHVLKALFSIDYNVRESNLIKPSAFEIAKNVEPPYVDNQQWKRNIQKMLDRKNLRDIFDLDDVNQPTFQDPLSEHVKWAFNHIYNVAYPKEYQSPEAIQFDIARYHHGITHVTSAALYVAVVANLYRKHGNEDANKLTNEDIKLLQIAALFHDSAREGEEEDRWDHESAILLYSYLTRILGVDKQKAKLISEATANKDPSASKGYFTIDENSQGEITFTFNKSDPALVQSKNIYQKIIHDVDSLEIIRARPSYDAKHLDFYKDFVKPGNKLALEEMAHLITEARSLIDIRGDGYQRTDAAIKKKFEGPNAHDALVGNIRKDEHKIIHALHNKLYTSEELKNLSLVDLTPYDPEKGLTEDNMRAAIREGIVLARGIETPSAIATRDKNESLAALEVRKTMREIGIPTQTMKDNRLDKMGNFLRSTSMIGYGSGIYSNAGFLIINPDINSISKVSARDINTGRGKKSHLSILKDKNARQTNEEIQNSLNQVHEKLKLGGEATTFSGGKRQFANHVEITYDITRFDAIYYSNDANFSNENQLNKATAVHPNVPLLQAIHLQKQYSIQYNQVREAYIQRDGNDKKFIERFGSNATLPMFEYSGTHNRVKKVPDSALSNEHIVKMWTDMCSDYIKKELSKEKGENIFGMNVDDIKTFSMYSKKENVNAKENAPADANYDDHLKNLVNQAIEKAKADLLDNHEKGLTEKVKKGELSVFSDEVFFNLLNSPRLLNSNKEYIKKEFWSVLEAKPKSSYLFLNKKLTEFFIHKTRNMSEEFVLEIPKNPYYRDFYFETEAIRLFVLSKRLNLTDEKDVIIKFADELAFLGMNDLKAIESDNLFEMVHLVYFLQAFDLFEKYKRDIDQTADALIADVISKIPEDISLFKVCDVVKVMSELGLMSEENISLLQKEFQIYGKRLLEMSEDGFTNTAVYFFKLADYLKINPKDDIMQEDLLTYLQNAGSPFYIDELLPFTKKFYSFEHDENLGIFTAYIGKLPSTGFLNSVDPFRWAQATISMLEGLMGDLQNVSEKQWNLVKEKWESLWDAYFRSKFNASSFVTLLESPKSDKFPFPIPDKAVRSFNKLIEDFAKNESPAVELTNEYRARINMLHDTLPLQSERVSNMVIFNEIKQSVPSITR